MQAGTVYYMLNIKHSGQKAMSTAYQFIYFYI